MSEKTKAVTSKLPDNLPDLIELAVRDAIKCEKDPKYRLRMSDWHIGSKKRKTCDVCMAGAIMAKTLRVSRTEYAVPSDYDLDWPNSSDISKKLYAIDDVRQGAIHWAAQMLGVHLDEARTSEAHDLINERFDTRRQRAPWPVYLEAARILREGARVEALESKEAR